MGKAKKKKIQYRKKAKEIFKGRNKERVNYGIGKANKQRKS